MSKPVQFLRAQWFSLALVAVFVGAWVFPRIGVSVNPGNNTQYYAIVTIFFLSGLILPTREALAGLLNWRVHVFINVFQFVLVPLCAWLALIPVRDRLEPGLMAGFCLLAALPTTISSCVTFTQLARGNVAASLFNAAAGNMAAIVITPTLLFLMLGGKVDHGQLNVFGTIAGLAKQVLAPFAIGQLVYLIAFGYPKRWHKRVAFVNSILILLIVWTAFCDMFAHPARIGNLSLADPRFLLPLLSLVPVHFVVLAMAGGGCKIFGFDRPDRVAIFFTATQKTLALGLPIAAATLGSDPRTLGLAILPIIAYHPLQLIVAGVMKNKM